MSIRKGNYLIAGNGANGLQLLDFKWSDHTINDLNWILSSSNSWHSGTTYKKLYNHLVEDYQNGVTETEEISGYTVTYNLAPDGHKIVLAANEAAVTNVYNATGVAWYYILDASTTQFKLPRTKYAFDSGTTSEIGKYVEPTLPNITGTFYAVQNTAQQYNGAFKDSNTQMGYSVGGGVNVRAGTFDFKASNSNSIYQNNATVQPPATKMLLYFYTAQFAGNGSGGGGSGGTVSISYDSTNQRIIFNSEG